MLVKKQVKSETHGFILGLPARNACESNSECPPFGNICSVLCPEGQSQEADCAGAGSIPARVACKSGRLQNVAATSLARLSPAGQNLNRLPEDLDNPCPGIVKLRGSGVWFGELRPSSASDRI